MLGYTADLDMYVYKLIVVDSVNRKNAPLLNLSIVILVVLHYTYWVNVQSYGVESQEKNSFIFFTIIEKLTAYNYHIHNILACLFYFIELTKREEIGILKNI